MGRRNCRSAHDRFDDFEHLARRCGACAFRALTELVQAAVAAGRGDGARAVLATIDARGEDADRLRERCRRLIGSG